MTSGEVEMRDGRKLLGRYTTLTLTSLLLILAALLYGGAGAKADGSFDITGTVTDPSGADVSGASVYATDPGSSTVDYGPVTTASDGTYDLSITVAGTYDIHFDPPSGDDLQSVVDGSEAISSSQTLNTQLPLQVCNESGTLSSSETWTPDCVYAVDSVNVTAGVTLTIDPGVVVKVVGDTGIEVYGGTLDAAGTSDSPIVFTSWLDDSAGGDSNGDGDATSPSVGDYGNAILADGTISNATIDVSHADFRYGTYSLKANCYYPDDYDVSATITDSTIESQVFGYGCEQGVGLVTLERNQFEMPSGLSTPAVELVDSDPSAVVLGGTDENTFTGDGPADVVYALGNSDEDIPSGSTWTIDGSSGAVVEADNLGVTGTVDLGAGAILKSDDPYSPDFNVSSGGTLDATGTSDNPVVFTSWLDDSVGGDSNGDGDATSPSTGDYEAAIAASSTATDPVINVSHAEFDYGHDSLDADCQYTSGVEATITDSTIDSTVFGYQCEQGTGQITLERNQFEMPSGLSEPAIYLDASDPSSIVLGGTDENTFAGSGEATAIWAYGDSSDDIASGETWTIDGSSDAVVQANDLGIAGEVDLGPGAIVKSEDADAPDFDVASGATLKATGTSDNPVVFTSWLDDSVGGDSNADGGATSPASGDYQSAIRFEDADSSDTVSYVVFKYAAQAISIGTWSNLAVDHVQFSYNEAAFSADTTSTNNPELESLAPDCVWPYGNTISITNSWFGSASGDGEPGSAFDLSGFVGETMPDPTDWPGLTSVYNDFTTLQPLVGNLGDNTIPWTTFTCEGVTFPVTPVVSANFTDTYALLSRPLWTTSNYAE